MLLLEVRDLHYSTKNGSPFAFNKRTRPVLSGVSFSLEEGSTLGLLGGSGSGKTTIAKCLAGLTDPDSGSISFHGLNIFPILENRAKAGHEIQMVFQGGSASLDPTMSIRESLLEGMQAAGKQHAEAGELAMSVGLSGDILSRYPHQLSGGQRQRVAIARTLAAEPRLLILDEPTSALDALTQVHILSLIRSIQVERRLSILYVTHDAPIAFAFCDRMAFLHEGRIVEDGRSSEILRNPQHGYTRKLLQDCRMINS